MRPETVLAIDIGNTRIHAGIVSVATLTCLGQNACMLDDLNCGFDALVKMLRGRVPVAHAVVSGVVRDAVDLAVRMLTASGFEVVRFSAREITSVTIKYSDRTQLGSDRCANALYAAARFPGKRTVVVSAGSALVVDLVDNGVFYGGAILPGVAMQCRSLHAFTDALPDVACADAPVVQLPGQSTEACISGGVLLGVAGAVERIAAVYCEQDTQKETVFVATGGDWPLLAPLVNLPFIAVPEMTLVGTALFSER